MPRAVNRRANPRRRLAAAAAWKARAAARAARTGRRAHANERVEVPT